MKNKSLNHVENLDMCDFEDNGFIDGDINTGKAIASFNFGISENQQINNGSAILNPISNKPANDLMYSSMDFRTSQRGLTPAVDGELYTIKRCYQFRQSTIRKLNEIKAKHPDINVYLNTLIDEAISYYYDYIINENSN
jgi:hypothetical protein